MRDPYIPARFGREYANALAHAELLELPDAGHWPWLDRPDLIERVVAFLSAE
jgi:pimeloyl-ACP methyl ester carboxylesterase